MRATHTISFKLYLLVAAMCTFIGIGLYAILQEHAESSKNKFYELITIALLVATALVFFIVRDIRKLIKTLEETNKKAEASEMKCRAFIEHAGDAIFILNEQTVIIDVNNAACMLLAYPRKELIGMKISEIVQPEELVKQDKYLNAIKASGILLSERKLKKKDGSTIETEVNTRWLENTGYVSVIRNIEDRKQIEEKLYAIEERYRSIISASNIGAWENNSDTGDVWYSPEFFTILGYKPPDDLHKELKLWIDLLHPDDKEMAINSFTEYVNSGSTDLYENHFRLRHKDGHWVWIWSRGKKMRDGHGNLTHITIGANIDITEQKIAEEKLRESGERYKSIITVSNTGAWEFHSDTAYLWCSPEYFSMLGRNSKDYDLSGKNNLQETWVDLLHPDDKEKSRQYFADYLKNGSQGTYESHFRLRHKDGHWVWVWSRGQTLRDTNGNLTNTTVGTHIDITERTRATELFKHQFENSPDLIVIVNSELKIDAINRAHPYTSEEIIGKDCIDVLPLESRKLAKENILKCFETKSKVEFENMLVDGRWVQSRIVPIIINGEINQVMIFATDITERKKAERERQEIQEQSMAMLEEKVAERTRELHETNRALNIRNHEMTDSINYAQNIQRAILSQSTDYYKIFPDSFVLWWPKDAVSGDFYWCYSNQQYDFIAVVDCTGHGVPGALMSIIASQTLDRVVNTYGYTEPKEILFRLDEAIVSTLKQETSLLEDGMDILLCRVDKGEF